MQKQYSLKFPLSIDARGRSITLDDGAFTHTFSDIPAPVFQRVLERFETPSNPREVASAFSTFSKEVNDLIDYCISEGIFTHGSLNSSTITGGEFAEYLKTCFRNVNDTLFSHSLWASLANGTAAESVVSGWLVETYFFIKGANARLPNAIAHCEDDHLRDMLLHHYLEEWDHYKFFRDSIKLYGLDPVAIDVRGPIPATKAVMLFARDAGRKDSLAYLACSGLLESTGSDASKAREFYGAVQKHYDLAGAGFVKPMLKHIDLDEEYEHGDLMAEALEKYDHISIGDANSVVNVIREFKETLMQWFDEIEEYYSSNQRSVYAQPVSATFSLGSFK